MRSLFSIFLFIGFIGSVSGQTTVIDFETAGEGYTPSVTSGSTTTDVFNRINVDIGPTTNESGFYWG